MAFLLCLFIRCLPLNHSHAHAADTVIHRFPISSAQMLHFDSPLIIITIITRVWIQSGLKHIHRCRGHHAPSASIFTRVFEELRQSASVTVTHMAHETPRCRSWETNHNQRHASADAQKSKEEERLRHLLSLSLRVTLTLNVSGLKSGNVTERSLIWF